jgi:NitT/TauT family transport system substrate-binding protein
VKYFWSALLALFTLAASAQAEEALSELRVQLPWIHQSQFTGLYVAQMRNHFKKEGLSVKLIEGGQNKSAANELRDGRVDIAITGLGNAWLAARSSEEQVTNIAQIISGAGYVLVCRKSAGVYSLKDMPGKKLGVWGLDEKPFIEALLKTSAVPIDAVELVIQKHDGSDLVNNKVACATSMLFDEYLNVIEMGVPYSDLLVIEPNKLDLPALLDGVYVDARRLQDPEFRAKLVGFLRALREGWRETRIAPTVSLESVRSVSATFDKEHQLKGLESMLSLIPAEPKKFGLLDLTAFELESARYIKQGVNPHSNPEKMWTHSIWNELQKQEGSAPIFTVATKHYLKNISLSPIFKIFVYFGVFVYALSGVLEAIHRNYDLWGRLILAFLSGIGGGTIRDLIIGGERLPFYYVKDPTYPTGIALVVVLASILVAFFPKADQKDKFKKVKKYSDMIGFSCLAVAGAVYAILADMPWYWVPALAALTCAGGGALRDIVINLEPHTFKGMIYEEAALLGGVFIVLGLWVANSFEHSATPVLVTIVGSTLFILAIKWVIDKYNIKYPQFICSSEEAHGAGH